MKTARPSKAQLDSIEVERSAKNPDLVRMSGRLTVGRISMRIVSGRGIHLGLYPKPTLTIVEQSVTLARDPAGKPVSSMTHAKAVRKIHAALISYIDGQP